MLTYEHALLERSESFQKFLDEQASKHRDYLEGFYTKSLAALGLAVTLVVGLFGILLPLIYAQQISSAKHKITTKFNIEIDQLVKEKFAEFQKTVDTDVQSFQRALESDKARANQQVENLRTLLAAQIASARADTEQDYNAAIEYSSVISYAAVVLSIAPTTDPYRNAEYNKERAAVIARLESLRDKVPFNRTFNIFLARLYRARGEYQKAADVLTKVLENRISLSDSDKADDAALLYNRACYRTLLAGEVARIEGMTPRGTDLLTGAWDDLKRCVQISPRDREDARMDPDLEGLIGSASDRASWDQL